MPTPNRPTPRHPQLSVSLTLLVLLSAALVFPAGAMAGVPAANDPQADDVLFGVDKFSQGAKEANEVTLNKAMLGLAAGMLGSGKDASANKGLMQKMDSVLVRDYEYAAPGGYRLEDVEQIRKRLDTNGWTHLVKEKTPTETTDICVKTDQEGVMSEMVIISAEPKELSFIHLRGHMSASDLGKVSGSFGGPAEPMLKERGK